MMKTEKPKKQRTPDASMTPPPCPYFPRRDIKVRRIPLNAHTMPAPRA
jgi:hypothetical protein